jgi:uncharacterized protein YndB with AHSA1/START domain
MEIRESVEILAPREKVFSLLLDVEKRTRLNPALEYMDVRRLGKGDACEGAKYRVKFRHGERIVEYVTEWLEVKKNKRIVYRTVEGPRFRVTQTLRDTFRGTRLTHTEDIQEHGLKEQQVKLARQILREWLRSIKGYLELDRNIATRLWKRFYDRFLLKAKPRERRIAQMILVIEGALLIAGLLTLFAFKLGELIFR